MEALDIDLLLDGNDWLHSAVLDRQTRGHVGKRLRLGLTAAGHKIILDQGIENFIAQVQMRCQRSGKSDFIPEIGFITPAPSRLSSLADGEDVSAIRSWIEDAGQHRLLLELSDDLTCFTGHFPGFPVLSGVVQLHWATRLAACLFGFEPEVNEIRQLKFRRTVIPPCWLELSLEQTRETEVRFQWSSHNQVHAQGNLVFTELTKC